MNKVNLLDDKYKQTNDGTFFAAKEIGDTLQGTYVDQTQRPNNYNKGEMTDYYVIKTDDGKYLIRDFPTIRDHMNNMKKGTLVAFKYIGEKASKDPAKKPYKNIEVFYDRNLVDKEWLEANEETDTEAQFASDEAKAEARGVPFESGASEFKDTFGGATKQAEPAALEVGPSVSQETVSTPTPSVTQEQPTTDKKGLIVELAKKKFNMAASTDEQVLERIMNETGLATVEKSYDTILDLLR